ncbi:unnamed protein product [Ilex paraguariensis]|uniref:Uncharacterized protein n=1 Tax=Ilex paraguariensis TaxID=185542 RepID=A0ABC8UG66_9AQUA
MEEVGRRHSVSNASGRSSQPSSLGIKRGPPRSYSVKEGASMPVSGLDPYMFPSKQKSVKGMFSDANLEKVKKAISKFFLFDAIPFNVTDSGPYYQSIIDTIADACPGIKDSTRYQIGSFYLEEEVQELDVYISSMKLIS